MGGDASIYAGEDEDVRRRLSEDAGVSMADVCQIFTRVIARELNSAQAGHEIMKLIADAAVEVN